MSVLLRLIVRGKWKSPGHSSDRSKDDTHQIKKEILDSVEVYFSTQVGDNPNIDIDPTTERIVLVGVGAFRRGRFITDLPASDFFVLALLQASSEESPEITLFLPASRGETTKSVQLACEKRNCQVYLLPKDRATIESFLDYILFTDREFRLERQMYIVALLG